MTNKKPPKETEDNLKAHKIRMKHSRSLNEKYLVNNGLHLIKLVQSITILPPNELAARNTFMNRYNLNTTSVKTIGHAFLLTHDDFPGDYRFVEGRYNNGNGIYWKGVNKVVSFDALKVLDPLFLIFHLDQEEENVSGIAIFDLTNPIMGNPLYWERGGKGNKNRLSNFKIGRDLSKQTGYPLSIPRKREELIEELTSYFPTKVNHEKRINLKAL